jgi:nucleotide-binding universal stress UspA family protein
MYKKILVPLDGSDLAECVLPHVATLIKGGGVTDVIFVRVVEPFHPPMVADYIFAPEQVTKIETELKNAAQDYLAQLGKKAKFDGVRVSFQMLHGNAAESLAEYAAKAGADLIVIATHGRSGVSRWVWGSVADRILRSSCVPVFMVRAPGCVPGL